jgi:hypothetical protein
VSLLAEYKLPDDIEKMIATGRESAERHVKGCATWQDYVVQFRKAHTNFADTSRHDPTHLRRRTNKNRRKLTAAERRTNFQITLIAAADACYIASILRQFTHNQDEIIAELKKGIKPRDPFLTDGKTPAPLIFADRFYTIYSGGREKAPIHRRILRWLIAVTHANPHERGKEKAALPLLRKMLEPAPIQIQIATTPVISDACPVLRETVVTGKAGWRQLPSLSAGPNPAA